MPLFESPCRRTITPASANRATLGASSWWLSRDRTCRERTCRRSSPRTAQTARRRDRRAFPGTLDSPTFHPRLQAGRLVLLPGTERIALTRLSPQAALEENVVPPGISEVVFVLEMKPLASLRQDLAEGRFPGILVVHLHEVFLQEPGVTVEPVVNLEVMQMRVGPAHRQLNTLVELVQVAVSHLNSPPDRRLDIPGE